MSAVVPEPRVLARTRQLGFLAVSTPAHRWRIGVEAATADEAIVRFYATHAEWLKLGVLVDADAANARPKETP